MGATTSQCAATPEQVLKELIHAGQAEYKEIKWGSGKRNVVIIDGKKYQYTEGGKMNKMLIKNLHHYILCQINL
jgi:hypothetical protein